MKLSPCPHDVIFGRGYKIVNRPGNQRYLKLVESLKAEYDDAPCRVKAQFSVHVMHTIHNLSPPGRFLTKDKESGDWKELETLLIVKKIRQAFRDFKPSSNSGREKKKTSNLLLSDSPSSSFCESKKKFRKKRVADSGKKNNEIIGESQNIVEKLLPKEQLHVVESHSLPIFPELSKHSGRSLEGTIQQSQESDGDDESDYSLSSFILHYLEQSGQVELRNTSSNNSSSHYDQHQHDAVIGSTIHTTTPPMAELVGNKSGHYFPQEHDDDVPQLRSSWQELQLNGGEDDEKTEQWTKFVQENNNEYSSAARRVTRMSSPATTCSQQQQESDCIYMDEMDIHMEDLDRIENIEIDGIDIDDEPSSFSHFDFSFPRRGILENKMMYYLKYSTKTEADQSSGDVLCRLHKRSVSLPESENRKQIIRTSNVGPRDIKRRNSTIESLYWEMRNS